MKKSLIAIIVAIATLVAFTATAQRNIWLYSLSGNHVSLPVTDLDSIGFEDPATLILSEYNKKLDSNGGSFNLGIQANQAWKAVSNNPEALTLSKTTGTGNDNITVTAMENSGTKSYSAIVTVTLLNGTYKQLIVTVMGTGSGSLNLDPEVKNLSSTGGGFALSIETDQAWTAVASDLSALTLSKTSGTGSTTINVTAVSNADTKPYTEYVTVELEDGTKKQLTVNVSVNDEYVYSDIERGKTIEQKGGTFNANVSSNTIWSVESDQPWMTVSPASGKYDGKVTVNVEANPSGDDEYATLTFTAVGGYTSEYSIVREGDKVSVSPSSENVKCEGGSVSVAVYSNTDWTVIADKNWVSLSRESGTGNMSVTLNVDGCIKCKPDTAAVTFTTSLGKNAMMKIFRAGYTGGGDAMTDINGKSYPTVWINGQNWMAENLKCNRYDTQSEAYNASWLYNNTIPTSDNNAYTPYYTDATDKTKWGSTEYSGNLSSGKIAKLGYLYNWAAAVGVENGGDYGTTPFSGNRQGICPNGWHVPTKAEWMTLYDYIYNDKQLSGNTVGKYLKTTSGWYKNGNGTDSYGFAALPSGYANGSSVFRVGNITNFWSATPSESINDCAYGMLIGYYYDFLSDGDYGRSNGRSVRCLRD